MKKAGLADELSAPGALTVFAPTNAAFAKVPEATLNALAKNPAALKRVLLYHVVAGKVTAAKVVKLQSAKTLAGPIGAHPRHRHDRPDQQRARHDRRRQGVERCRARDRPRPDPACRLVEAPDRPAAAVDQWRRRGSLVP